MGDHFRDPSGEFRRQLPFGKGAGEARELGKGPGFLSARPQDRAGEKNPTPRFSYAFAAVGRTGESLWSYDLQKDEYIGDAPRDIDVAQILESAGQIEKAREILKSAVV